MVVRMFAVFCPYQEARVLLSPGNILEMERRADGVAVRYRCWCGHVGVHVIASAARPTTPVREPAPAATEPAPSPARSTARVTTPRAVPAPC